MKPRIARAAEQAPDLPSVVIVVNVIRLERRIAEQAQARLLDQHLGVAIRSEAVLPEALPLGCPAELATSLLSVPIRVALAGCIRALTTLMHGSWGAA
jgi:hypothetical protein